MTTIAFVTIGIIILLILCLSKACETSKPHYHALVVVLMSATAICIAISTLQENEYCRVPVQVKVYQLPDKIIIQTNNNEEFMYFGIKQLSAINGKNFEIVRYENAWGISIKKELVWEN
jgi:hypothetical protein